MFRARTDRVPGRVAVGRDGHARPSRIEKQRAGIDMDTGSSEDSAAEFLYRCYPKALHAKCGVFLFSESGVRKKQKMFAS
jgi:hypothetical protein